MSDVAATPRPRLIDHLRVAWLLVLTVLGVVPVLLWILLSPVLCPLLRARQRRRLRRDAGAPADPPRPDVETWNGRTVFLVAGEASGDRLAAPVVERMLSLCPGLIVRGYGGPAVAGAGARLDKDLIGNAVVGVVAVVKTLGFWWSVCTETLARLREDPPDVFLTVDFPGLNARLARWARKRGVHTVHLVAPASWAYMPWRTLRWRLALDRLLATFPFEAVLLEGSGVPSTFVGHPLFEAPLPPPRTPETWPGAGPCRVELLPGSRHQEIRAHAALLLDAAAEVEVGLPDASIEYVVRLAEAEHRAVFDDAASSAARSPGRLVFVTHADADADTDADTDTHGAARESDLPLLGAIASSGTVTAELGADAVPMAIVYRLSPFAAFGAWVGLITPFFGLANLIAGRQVVPERIQSSRSGRHVAEDFLGVVGTPDAWARTRAQLVERVRDRIAVPDVADRAARAVLQEPPRAARSASAPSAAPVGESGARSRPAGGPS